MQKGSRKCRACSRQAIGCLVYRGMNGRLMKGGAHGCFEHLFEATHREYAARLSVERLVLARAKIRA